MKASTTRTITTLSPEPLRGSLTILPVVFHEVLVRPFVGTDDVQRLLFAGGVEVGETFTVTTRGSKSSAVANAIDAARPADVDAPKRLFVDHITGDLFIETVHDDERFTRSVGNIIALLGYQSHRDSFAAALAAGRFTVHLKTTRASEIVGALRAVFGLDIRTAKGMLLDEDGITMTTAELVRVILHVFTRLAKRHHDINAGRVHPHLGAETLADYISRLEISPTTTKSAT